jgi:hypothetical protein
MTVKKSTWLIPSICVMSLAMSAAMAADSKTGEHQYPPPKSRSDNLDKKIREPYVQPRVETPPHRDACSEGSDGDWCRSMVEGRK